MPMEVIVTARPALRALIVWFALTLAIAATPPPAVAQMTEAWLEATPLDPSSKPHSPRVDAMGGLQVAIEDEETRVDIYDFTDNPAGLLADRDTSSVEQFSDYGDFQDGYFGLDHSAVQRHSSVRAALRSTHSWAIGLDGMYGEVKASRHDLFPSPDEGRFIRDFDLPLPSVLAPVTGDRTFGAKIEAPRARLTYARAFGSRLTLGVRTSYSHESEDRKVLTPYPIDHTSRSGGISGGALYAFGHGGLALTAGGFGRYSTDKVIGRSETPLNKDRYDWYRPQVGYGGQVAVRSGSWLKGVMDARHSSWNGEDVAQVNWAPFFFLNPLPASNQTTNVFKRKWSAFLSGFRHNEASTRWMASLPGVPIHLGWSYRYYREFEWIHPNPEVLIAAQELDVRRLGYEGVGGLSIDLGNGEGLVASEVHYGRDNRLDFTGALPEIKAERISYHFGAEYRARPWLPLRGGVVMIRQNYDTRSSMAPVKGFRVTAGSGYYWKWLGAQLDAAYTHEHLRFSPGEPSQEASFGDGISITARHFF